MTSYEFERALVFLAEQIIKTFGKDFETQEMKQEPAEPLIKDEKIRKAVRAWAEANEVFGASTYKSCSDGHYWYIRAFNDTERGIDIDLWGELPKELIDCKYYTIAELCGEEKE